MRPFEFILESEIDQKPQTYKWDGMLHPWVTDGSRTAANKAIASLSVRASMALLLVAGEWMNFRLFGTKGDPQMNLFLKAAWLGLENPSCFIASGVHLYGDDKIADPSFGPLREFVHDVKSCFRIALDMDGAYSSYVESALKLVEYTMPNKAYQKWRLGTLKKLQALAPTPSFIEGARKMNAEGDPLEIQEIWGSLVDREYFAHEDSKRAFKEPSKDFESQVDQLLQQKNPFVQKPTQKIFVFEPY